MGPLVLDLLFESLRTLPKEFGSRFGTSGPFQHIDFNTLLLLELQHMLHILFTLLSCTHNYPVITGLIFKITYVMMMGPNKQSNFLKIKGVLHLTLL